MFIAAAEELIDRTPAASRSIVVPASSAIVVSALADKPPTPASSAIEAEAASPIVITRAAAPVAILTACATASSPMFIAPPDEFIDRAVPESRSIVVPALSAIVVPESSAVAVVESTSIPPAEALSLIASAAACDESTLI